MTFPGIFEGKLAEKIQEKLMEMKSEKIQRIPSKEINSGMSIEKINEIENILINDFKNGINYELFYKYIISLLTDNNKLKSKEKINVSIIKKLMTKIRLINIFLLMTTNKDNSTDTKKNNSKELIDLNNLLLDLFDEILIDNKNDLKNEIKKILDYNINNLIKSLNKEKTPQIGINKLE
jgi:hypothetical protein